MSNLRASLFVCMNSLDDTIQVKSGSYDNINGKYVQKDVLIVDYLKGTGMEKFKQFITTVATDRLKCGFQMPGSGHNERCNGLY